MEPAGVGADDGEEVTGPAATGRVASGSGAGVATGGEGGCPGAGSSVVASLAAGKLATDERTSPVVPWPDALTGSAAAAASATARQPSTRRRLAGRIGIAYGIQRRSAMLNRAEIPTLAAVVQASGSPSELLPSAH